MTILAPSLAKLRAISLPMLLAAPATTATLSLRRIDLLPAADRLRRIRREIIVHDLAEPQRQVAEDVHRGDDFEDRQLGDGCHGMGTERQGAGPRSRLRGAHPQ